jgi:pimeloyl-ACP methyl ester carboxylesterase
MKRISAVALTLAPVVPLLAGCDDSSGAQTNLPVGATAQFSPSAGLLPLPNDLLFSGSTDGTLNAPVPANPAQAGVTAALNALDGWSTVAPVAIPFSSTLDGATILGGAVRVFRVSTTGIGGAVTGVEEELTFGLDYFLTLSPDSRQIVILPLQPLSGASTYLVVVTDGVLDTDGNPVERSVVFDLATADEPAEDPALAPLQVLIGAMLDAAEGEGIAAQDVVMSFTFRTQSIGTVLQTLTNVVLGLEVPTIQGLCAANPGLDCSEDDLDPNNVATVQNFALTNVVTIEDRVDVYQGELTVPTYLTAAEAGGAAATDLTQDAAPLSEHWNARFGFLPVDTEHHVTGLNPLPASTGTVTIPVLVTTPKGRMKPVDGWPVVIFQHGITKDRTVLLGALPDDGAEVSLADAFATEGFACVAIDLPLHGISDGHALGAPLPGGLFAGFETAADAVRERTYGLDLLDNTSGLPNPAGDGFADPSGAHFINLASLRTSRDNLRQGAVDLLWLLSTIDLIDIDGDRQPDFDADDVHFVGHSLGAIVGTLFLQYAPQVRPLRSATLGMPGGGISELLLNSPAFGPQILAGLAAASGLTNPSAAFSAFVAQFSFVTQAVVDDGDPINYASNLVPLGGPAVLPIHAIEVIGEDGVSDPDQTIPNSVATAPLSGTEPLLARLGLEDIESDTSGGTIRGAVRFLRGNHDSLILPSLPLGADPTLDAATFEMWLQTVEFAVTDGTSLTLDNEAILDTGD